jgi:tRNA(fMet)-specific endonuclease VapC
MLKYLLDTNIVIYVIKRRPLEVLEELIHWVEKSSDVARNLSIVEDFVSRLTVLAYEENAACQYGSIRATLEKLGQPIGVNDLHIAAQARSSGLVLVSNNQREFAKVPGLVIENWVQPVV